MVEAQKSSKIPETEVRTVNSFWVYGSVYTNVQTSVDHV